MSNAVLLEMRKKKTSHILHLILSLITGGLWIIVWIICALSNRSYNAEIDKQINKILEAEARAKAERH